MAEYTPLVFSLPHLAVGDGNKQLVGGLPSTSFRIAASLKGPNQTLQTSPLGPKHAIKHTSLIIERSYGNNATHTFLHSDLARVDTRLGASTHSCLAGASHRGGK